MEQPTRSYITFKHYITNIMAYAAQMHISQSHLFLRAACISYIMTLHTANTLPFSGKINQQIFIINNFQQVQD